MSSLTSEVINIKKMTHTQHTHTPSASRRYFLVPSTVLGLRETPEKPRAVPSERFAERAEQHTTCGCGCAVLVNSTKLRVLGPSLVELSPPVGGAGRTSEVTAQRCPLLPAGHSEALKQVLLAERVGQRSLSGCRAYRAAIPDKQEPVPRPIPTQSPPDLLN